PVSSARPAGRRQPLSIRAIAEDPLLTASATSGISRSHQQNLPPELEAPMNRYIALLIAAQLAALSPVHAEARCSAPAELEEFRQSVKRELACASAALQGTTGCAALPAPACAGDAPSELLELTLDGPPSPVEDRGALAAQMRCQQTILRSAAAF